MLGENSTSAKYKKKLYEVITRLMSKEKRIKCFQGKCPSEIETILVWITKIRKQHRKSRQKKRYTVFWNLLLIAVIKIRICQDNELKHNITYLIIVCHNQPCLFKRAAIAMEPAIFKALTMMRLDDLKCIHSIRNAYAECGLLCTYCVDERVLAICAILFFSPFSIRHHLPISNWT